MSNKEIVEQGLQARKDVRAANTRAAKHREETEAVQDARFRDQMEYKQAEANWQRERGDLEWRLQLKEVNIQKLTKERDALIEDQKEDLQRRRLVGVAQAVAFFALMSISRDADLVNVWLANGTMGAAAGYLAVTLYFLIRKKK